jgi:hypothetical protein
LYGCLAYICLASNRRFRPVTGRIDALNAW